MTVRMELSRIFIRELSDMQLIELTEVGGERTFPIVIGLPEAFAIERRLKGTEVVRPQTHDLLASVIRGLGGTLTSIEIHKLAEGTFYANLHVKQGEQDVVIDSRPSDAIALGVAEKVPIFVAEKVLAQAVVEAGSANAAADEGPEFGATAIEFDDADDEDDDEGDKW
jgi:uncharacterized protein